MACSYGTTIEGSTLTLNVVTYVAPPPGPPRLPDPFEFVEINPIGGGAIAFHGYGERNAKRHKLHDRE